MKRALITGITGQDGAYLAEFLIEKGYEVHGIKRRSSSFNTARIDHLYQDPHDEELRFILHYGDLTDATNLIRVIQEVKPHELYNLASACYTVMALSDEDYKSLCATSSSEPDNPTISHINIGTGNDLPLFELAKIIKDIVGFQGQIFWDQSKSDGTPRKLLDITRLKQIGWQPRISLSEGIRNTYSWYLEKTRTATA